jgi:hypothetical protein
MAWLGTLPKMVLDWASIRISDIDLSICYYGMLFLKKYKLSGASLALSSEISPSLRDSLPHIHCYDVKILYSASAVNRISQALYETAHLKLL